MIVRGTHEVYVYDESTDEEYEVNVAWCITGAYTPARTYGPPENCYPAEYPDIDIEAITVEAFGRTYEVELDELTKLADTSQEDIETAIFEQHAEDTQAAHEYWAEAAADY